MSGVRKRPALAMLGLILPLLGALLAAPTAVEARPFVGADFQSYTSKLLKERGHKKLRHAKAHRGAKKHLRRARHRHRPGVPPVMVAGAGSVILGSHSEWPLSNFGDDAWPLDLTQPHEEHSGDTPSPLVDDDDAAGLDLPDNDLADETEQNDGPQPGDVLGDEGDDEDEGGAPVAGSEPETPSVGEPHDESVNEPGVEPTPDFIELASEFESDVPPAPSDDSNGDGNGNGNEPLVMNFTPVDPLALGPFGDQPPVNGPADVGGPQRVPEPASLALVGVALMVAGRRARRARATPRAV